MNEAECSMSNAGCNLQQCFCEIKFQKLEIPFAQWGYAFTSGKNVKTLHKKRVWYGCWMIKTAKRESGSVL